MLKRGGRTNKGNRKNKDIKGFKDIKDFKDFRERHNHTSESAYRPRDMLVTPNAQKTQITR